MHLDNTNIKSIPYGQNKWYKNSLFFLSVAPTHHSFTLCELNHKARLSKTVYGILYFRFRFVLIKVHVFIQKPAWTLCL